MARLDRIYSDVHVVDQLHEEIFATVLDWPTQSQHRPVIFARRTPPEGHHDVKPIPEWVIQKDEWPL